MMIIPPNHVYFLTYTMNEEKLSSTSSRIFSSLTPPPLSTVLLLSSLAYGSSGSSSSTSSSTTTNDGQKDGEQTKSIMQPAREDLLPPKDDPFTLEELKAFDGSTVFDVSRKSDVYGPGKGYNVFAGKDGSRGLGKSSLKTEDAVPDWSVLEDKDRKTLDDWYTFFEKRYNIVGRVSDMPAAVAPFVISHSSSPSTNL
ncbi:hypothetical protein D9758_013620 [Tetrapyrgos nigripes]|uniref:Cytochrome b5 heme-binding domain-containing protein n=1 Tax=Tetrapyrgos nigripes TaxID=182062 RepID=A0A8H5CQY1_9AGAR|nr:hypothetical protein D9758_013620 [Tetrapyrgos nigripes]